MADTNRTRLAFRAAAVILVALGQSAAQVPILSPAPARAAPRPQQMGGTWDLTWKSRRGNVRTGYMEIEQRGSQLFAQVYDRGGASATGSVTGSNFTLSGRRMFIPFTVTGRVKGRRMTGLLTAPGTERHFTGIRRGRR